MYNKGRDVIVHIYNWGWQILTGLHGKLAEHKEFSSEMFQNLSSEIKLEQNSLELIFDFQRQELRF